MLGGPSYYSPCYMYEDAIKSVRFALTFLVAVDIVLLLLVAAHSSFDACMRGARRLLRLQVNFICGLWRPWPLLAVLIAYVASRVLPR